MSTGRSAWALVLVYALGHATMEFLAGFGLCYSMRTQVSADMFLLYNMCAFLTPALIGLFTDDHVRPGVLAAAGAVILGVGLLVVASPLATVISLGLGNACFHVGGGAATLRLTHYKTTAVGLFLGPGACGLALGLQAGRGEFEWSWLLVVAALTVAGAVFAFGSPQASEEPSRASGRSVAWSGPILAALAVVVVVRSMVPGYTPSEWKVGSAAVLLAAAAAMTGKMLGGILGDLCGAVRTATVSLAAAAVLLPFFSSNMVISLAGLVLLNISVSIVLVGIAEQLPGHEGFAMGLGQTFQFSQLLVVGTLAAGWVCLALVVCAALALYALNRAQSSVTGQAVLI
jgi:FSR family fosmidomycin resistance protein-like MFS transporter